MSQPVSLTKLTDALRHLMDALELKGSYEITWRGQRASGWTGKPGGDDFAVKLSVEILPPLGRSSVAP